MCLSVVRQMQRTDLISFTEIYDYEENCTICILCMHFLSGPLTTGAEGPFGK